MNCDRLDSLRDGIDDDGNESEHLPWKEALPPKLGGKY